MANTRASAQPARTQSTPAPTRLHGPWVFSVGQLAEGSSYAARVTRISECQGKDGYRAGPAQLLLGVELEVRAPNDKSLPLGHSHTKLTDDSKTVYPAQAYARTENCEPRLKYSRLTPRETKTAWLVFAIPKAAHHLTLTLHPRPYLDEPPTQFTLGR